MIREINKNIVLLQRDCIEATAMDLEVARDLLDTLQYHKENCVGMAANMIGVCKRIIAIQDMETGKYVVMLNPEIMKTSKTCYEAEEGCLSLTGTRKTKRYQSIKVKYLDEHMKLKIKTFKDFTAQIIQHEIDHCNGILI